MTSIKGLMLKLQPYRTPIALIMLSGGVAIIIVLWDFFFNGGAPSSGGAVGQTPDLSFNFPKEYEAEADLVDDNPPYQLGDFVFDDAAYERLLQSHNVPETGPSGYDYSADESLGTGGSENSGGSSNGNNNSDAVLLGCLGFGIICIAGAALWLLGAPVPIPA